eukprot:GHVN01001163.1.p1 GENE.GHVN01001163.1~~GHVN01001163.1.p1  ORF type:complete len:378 (-),score=24.81 GHVN01001163.1:51-1184(-)
MGLGINMIAMLTLALVIPAVRSPYLSSIVEYGLGDWVKVLTVLGKVDIVKVACCCLGVGSAFSHTSQLYIADIFPPLRKMALTMLAASLSLGAMIFVGFNVLHDLKWPLEHLICSHIALVAVLALLSMCLTPSNAVLERTSKTTKQNESAKATELTEIGLLDPIIKGGWRRRYDFLTFVLYRCINSLLLNFYLATHQEFLKELENPETRPISKLSGALVPIGSLLAPLFGLLLKQKNGILKGVVSVQCCISFAFIATTVPLTLAHIFGIITYASVRPWSGGLTSNLLAEMVGLNNFAKFYGATSVISGLTTAQFAPTLTGFASSYSMKGVYWMCILALMISGLVGTSSMALDDKKTAVQAAREDKPTGAKKESKKTK